ncbi:MAG TPA: hypothetical protein VEC57_12710 [Candidatus Limnocylindrales bacterium]|nr:hypothetical protein [Candidatus Limnocylindrales bacterium]
MSTADSHAAPPRRPAVTVAGRPRFVAVLATAALGAVAYDLWRLLTASSAAPVHWLGLDFRGGAAVAAAAARIAVHAVGAWGLWQLRPWGRMAGMIYLGALLASMLFLWRPAGYGASSAGTALLWQISMIPLCTFCLMYLYRGHKDFEARGRARNDP